VVVEGFELAKTKALEVRVAGRREGMRFVFLLFRERSIAKIAEISAASRLRY
jgi:hypothetical protein